MPEACPGGFSEFACIVNEQNAKPEIKESQAFGRTELLNCLNQLSGFLSTLDLKVYEPIRYGTEVKPMPQIESSKQALFETLESIDLRMLSLLWPMGKDKYAIENDLSRGVKTPNVLEQNIPYYSKLDCAPVHI